MQGGEEKAGGSNLLVNLLERALVFVLVLHEVTHANDLVQRFGCLFNFSSQKQARSRDHLHDT